MKRSLPFPPHSSPSSSVSHGGLAHASVGFRISACTGWCQFFTRARTWRCVLQCEVLQDNCHGARRGVTGPVWCICLPTSAPHGHTSPSVGWVCMMPTAWVPAMGPPLGLLPGGWDALGPTSRCSARVLGSSTSRRLARPCLIPGGEEGCCLALERSPCPRGWGLPFLPLLSSLQFLPATSRAQERAGERGREGA